MRIYGIFRGFAGLGRVVSGIGLLNKFRDEGHEVKIFTYMQGCTISSQYGYSSLPVKGEKDIGFMGIVPISPTGLSVITDILIWKPDCILIDGEPLMIECLRLAGVSGKIIALTNPLDLYSEKNNPVTMKYFRHLFSQSDIILCHGIHNVEKHLKGYLKDKTFCMNTILRNEIFSIKRNNPKYIACILGGGTKNCSDEFVNSTLRIAGKVILLAKKRQEEIFNIYCNDDNIGERIKRLNPSSNVNVIVKYTSPVDIYSKSKIVIGRGGRNTISELLFLKIPSIVIPIASDIVSIEQKNNIQYASNISNNNIIGYNLLDESEKIISIFDNLIHYHIDYNDWIPGNKKAYSIIKEIIN